MMNHFLWVVVFLTVVTQGHPRTCRTATSDGEQRIDIDGPSGPLMPARVWCVGAGRPGALTYVNLTMTTSRVNSGFNVGEKWSNYLTTHFTKLLLDETTATEYRVYSPVFDWVWHPSSVKPVYGYFAYSTTTGSAQWAGQAAPNMTVMAAVGKVWGFTLTVRLDLRGTDFAVNIPATQFGSTGYGTQKGYIIHDDELQQVRLESTVGYPGGFGPRKYLVLDVVNPSPVPPPTDAPLPPLTPPPVPPPGPPLVSPVVRVGNTIASNHSVIFEIVQPQFNITESFGDSPVNFGNFSAWSTKLEPEPSSSSRSTVNVYSVAADGSRGELLVSAQYYIPPGPMVVVIKGEWPLKSASQVYPVAASYAPPPSGMTSVRLASLSPDVSAITLYCAGKALIGPLRYPDASPYEWIAPEPTPMAIVDSATNKTLVDLGMFLPPGEPFTMWLEGDLEAVDKNYNLQMAVMFDAPLGGTDIIEAGRKPGGSSSWHLWSTRALRQGERL